jgi:RNA polymerase sigma factor (sigma-70 family)
MRDGEIVGATLAGDPAALIDAYDQYAPGLYAYCRSMLSRPADAADAVQDTFVVAAAKLGGLRDPGRLRPWLFAVARNECRHQLDGPRVSRSADDDDMTMISERIRLTDSGQPSDEPGQQELVSSALATLSREDQEIVELTVRHELSGADLADVLGVPPDQAQLLASRARARLDSALSTVLTARPRLGACPELASLLTDSAAELTGAERKLVRRHLCTCPICTDHERPEVNAAALLGAQPAPVPPSGLRFQVLSLLRDTSPGAVAYRAEVAERAEPFTRSGFPAAVAPASAARSPVSFVPAAGLLIALFAVFGGGAVLVSNTLHHAADRGPATVTPAASAHAAPTVPTLGTGHRHGKKGAQHGTRSPGSTAYPSGKSAGKSGSKTSHQASPTPTRAKHSSQPSSQPATTPASTPSTTPPASPTPTGTSTGSGVAGGSSSSLVGSIIGLLSAV